MIFYGQWSNGFKDGLLNRLVDMKYKKYTRERDLCADMYFLNTLLTLLGLMEKDKGIWEGDMVMGERRGAVYKR